MVGRTHGVHAEPLTFGLVLALWYEEMRRNRRRVEFALDGILSRKASSGAVGTYAHVDPFVEQYVCGKLGLKPAPLSTQIVQRDRHAFCVATLSVVAGTLEKIATDLRSYARTEIREVEEPFRPGQKGSSAMPHKKNPVGLEQICGMARLMRGYASAAFENNNLWDQRDISNSSVERIILPDSLILLDYALNRMAGILEGLKVYPDRMLLNLNLTGGLIFSEEVLLRLVSKGSAGSRHMQKSKGCHGRVDGPPSFKERVINDSDLAGICSREELESCFDLTKTLCT